MAGVTAHGGTFTFLQFSAFVVGVSVETPTAEIADMSGIGDGGDRVVLVPTGAWSGGSVTVDYLRDASTGDPQTIVRRTGFLTFASAGFNVSRQVILESASSEARAGELVRGTLRFRVTDYLGN